MRHSVQEIKDDCSLESFFMRVNPNFFAHVLIVKQSNHVIQKS